MADTALEQELAIEAVKALSKDFALLLPGFQTLNDYYNGDHPLPAEPARLTATYQDLLTMSVSNWTRLIVDVVAERLVVGSFDSSTPTNSKQAWEFWRVNRLAGKSIPLHTEALKLGVAYASVYPDGGGGVQIQGETPLQCYVAYDEDNPSLAIAALKLWQLWDGGLRASMWTADWVYRFFSQAPRATGTASTSTQLRSGVDVSRINWEPYVTDVADWSAPNPMGVVPFTAFYCAPDLTGGYMSEIENVLPIQDRINKTTFHRLLTQEFTAFPQKWVTGIDIPIDPDTGKRKEPFNVAVDRLWVSENDNTRFGQFPQASLEPYLKSVEADIQALATQSRTPPHYLTGGMGQFPSGESVRATEYGLFQKVRSRQESFGDSWAAVMRMAGQVMKSAIADDSSLTTRWEDVEAHSEAELVDALLKMSTLGVPKQELWRRWGAEPEDIEKWTQLQITEMAIQAGLVNPASPGAGLSFGQSGPPSIQPVTTA